MLFSRAVFDVQLIGGWEVLLNELTERSAE
jgi:hypothetical protein